MGRYIGIYGPKKAKYNFYGATMMPEWLLNFYTPKIRPNTFYTCPQISGYALVNVPYNEYL